MCAIIDAANVGNELWDPKGNDAGRGFRKAVDAGRIPLVGGGSKLMGEFTGSGQRMMNWFAELRRSGKLTLYDNDDVDARTGELKARPPNVDDGCTSDDHHIVALAQLSGARLLYTNDQRLTRDFGNNQLIDAPRGKIYSTRVTDDFSPARKRLLARTDLCR
ncbi:hypothetical protein [Candidatus Poriferisodalis sp.]|uniref:hypothetical protein n=1 Tax=Candidatus Poriferisodalis sp. TaxID=3101277 RepID=UPI003D13E7AB